MTDNVTDLIAHLSTLIARARVIRKTVPVDAVVCEAARALTLIDIASNRADEEPLAAGFLRAASYHADRAADLLAEDEERPGAKQVRADNETGNGTGDKPTVPVDPATSADSDVVLAVLRAAPEPLAIPDIVSEVNKSGYRIYERGVRDAVRALRARNDVVKIGRGRYAAQMPLPGTEAVAGSASFVVEVRPVAPVTDPLPGESPGDFDSF